MRRLLASLLLLAAWCAHADVVLPLSVTASNINVAMGVSQSTGYAPLAVVFSTVGTTSATGVTTRPFDGMQYTWNFGDSGAGSWSYGVRAGASASKNTHSGPIAAHVYETPGTYTVTLTVTDGTNTATKTQTITVSDPDGAGSPFLGTQTVCVTTGSDFTGCPSGATQVPSSTSIATAISDHLGANKRILFRRGDSWTGTVATLNQNGRWIIGAYGSGAKPSFTLSSGTSPFQLGTAGNTFSNGSIQDFTLACGSIASSVGVNAGGTFNNILLYRIDSSGCSKGFSFDNSISTLQSIWRNVVLADNTVNGVISGSGGAALWGVFRSSAFIGNLFNSAGGGEFNMRTMYSDTVLISDNKFTTPSATKSNLSIRAPDWVFCNQTTVYTVPNGTYTQNVQVAYNEFVGDSTGGGDIINSSPASSPGGCPDARIRYLLVERNLLYGVTYTGSATYSGMAFADMSYSTVRSNLVDLSTYAGSGNLNGISMGNSGSNYNLAYNNTIYGGAVVATTMRGIHFNSSADNGVCKNNLAYFAAGVTNSYGCQNQGTNATATNNSTDNAQAETDPQLSNYSTTVPLTSADWKPAGGSYATGAGASVPVWSDMFGTAWSPTWSMGAVHP